MIDKSAGVFVISNMADHLIHDGPDFAATEIVPPNAERIVLGEAAIHSYRDVKEAVDGVVSQFEINNAKSSV